MSKIELGGGKKPRGDGWVNLDILPTADIVCDLSAEEWPLHDDAVDDVYSSHFFEHVDNMRHVLAELVRVCRIGAVVEIRVPHWNSAMAMCDTHRRTVPPKQVDHWCKDFAEEWFAGCKKRLKHLRTEYIPGDAFGEAKDLFGWLTDEQIMRLIPDACHECRFYFRVEGNA